MSALTVYTQNIWGGVARWPARRELLATRLDALRPEVVALQEVHAASGELEASQAHELAARVGGYKVFFAPGRRAVSGVCEGVALLVRRDARGHDPLALTLDPSDRFEGANQRVVVAATVEHPEGPVDVFATHLSLSRNSRTRTARELLDFAKSVRERSGSIAAVVMGDLNASPDEPAVEAIESEWFDVWRARGDAKTNRGGTWPAVLPFRRLDYVFAQPSTRVTVGECRRVPYSGSDHLGVYAQLWITARAAV